MIEGPLALPVLLPVLFWAGYHYHKDRHLPEPPANLVLCFALGIAAAWLSRSMYASLEPLGLRLDAAALANSDPGGLFWYAVLVIGPIEELAKLLPFVAVALRFKAFDDDLDGIIYASFIALGYAAIENAHYLEFLSTTEAIARGFAGPLIHIAFASIWGYLIGHARLAGRPILLPALAGFGVSAVLHGIYDYFALSRPHTSLVGAGAVIVLLWVWRLVVIRRLQPAGPEDRTTESADQPRS
jgi:RsiW-degrading membrane proteinase PrsW (M82 family)